jgi:RND family efflux transporter MFP subunit
MHMDIERKQKLMKIAGIVFVFLVVVDLIVHYKALHQAPLIPIPAVVISRPELMKMAEYITQTGNMVAYNSVDLVARVEGFLQEIHFTDGTLMKKDQPLFVIEPQSYMEQLLAAKATVTARQAQTAYAKAEYARQQRMYKENATSLNNVEIWLAKSHEAAAEVAKAKADEAIAAINYGYTHINAPFDGRIGRHLVDIGNLVGNGVATNLATIEQLDPIYVYFNLNELDFIKIRNAARKNGYDDKKIRQVPVALSVQNETGFNYEGLLDFVNTGLNASTGTMEFRALVPNKKRQLVPGLFVQVRVAVSEAAEQLTIPDTAILYDQIGAYVLVVNQDNIVELKRVSTGAVESGRRAILTGLDANDQVITSGLQNATPGNPVSPQKEIKAV